MNEFFLCVSSSHSIPSIEQHFGKKPIFQDDCQIFSTSPFPGGFNVSLYEETDYTLQHFYEGVKKEKGAYLSRINGDFAFAFWEEGKLYMAKDHFGSRPLFYYQDEDKFIVASSMPLIRAAVPLTIDRDYLRQILQRKAVPLQNTFFKEVKRFPPAHFGYFSLEDRILHLEKYWVLKKVDISSFSSDDMLLGELQARLEAAIINRSRTSGKVGCQLSGGLDSSYIAGILAKNIPTERLYTYSFVLNEKTRQFSENRVDEKQTQNALIQKYQLQNHHPIEDFHFSSAKEEFDRSWNVMGGFSETDSIWQDTLYKNASDDNVKIMFSGFPGDEGISDSGYWYFIEEVQGWRWINFLFKNPLKNGRKILRYWLKFVSPSQVPKDQIKSYADYLKCKIQRPHTTLRTESEGLYAATHGIEMRYPLADIRVLEFLISLPKHFFEPHAYTRSLFRKLSKETLPEEIRLQKKNNGALTLAFAEYWINNNFSELKGQKLQDPYQLYSNAINHPSKSTLTEKKQQVDLYKLDYFINRQRILDKKADDKI